MLEKQKKLNQEYYIYNKTKKGKIIFLPFFSFEEKQNRILKFLIKFVIDIAKF